jgi:hypothetical protein
MNFYPTSRAAKCLFDVHRQLTSNLTRTMWFYLVRSKSINYPTHSSTSRCLIYLLRSKNQAGFHRRYLSGDEFGAIARQGASWEATISVKKRLSQTTPSVPSARLCLPFSNHGFYPGDVALNVQPSAAVPVSYASC